MRHLCLRLGVLLLAGCANKEPYQRTDVWYPTGSNAGNIAAMAVNPNDLIRGHGSLTTDAVPATIAVDRILLDHPKPLISSS